MVATAIYTSTNSCSRGMNCIASYYVSLNYYAEVMYSDLPGEHSKIRKQLMNIAWIVECDMTNA